MERITTFAQAEAIGEAMRIVGPNIMRRLQHVHFLCGVAPSFVGLHQLRVQRAVYGSIDTDYDATAHVAYPWHCSDGEHRTTVVLPSGEGVATIVHELGHCLDEVLGFEHVAIPINDYAALDRMEAFAEALVARHFWMEKGEQNSIADADRATVALFDMLEAS